MASRSGRGYDLRAVWAADPARRVSRLVGREGDRHVLLVGGRDRHRRGSVAPMRDMDMPISSAWAELIEALTLLAHGSSDSFSPLHCEHDTLTVMSDPEAFSPEELARLEELGFHPGEEQTFYSFRFGSA
jgi:hypothetical protein